MWMCVCVAEQTNSHSFQHLQIYAEQKKQQPSNETRPPTKVVYIFFLVEVTMYMEII